MEYASFVLIPKDVEWFPSGQSAPRRVRAGVWVAELSYAHQDFAAPRGTWHYGPKVFWKSLSNREEFCALGRRATPEEVEAFKALVALESGS